MHIAIDSRPPHPAARSRGRQAVIVAVVLLNDHGAVVVVTMDETCHDDGVPAMVAVAPNTIAVVVERYLAVKWPVSPERNACRSERAIGHRRVLVSALRCS